MTTNSLLTANLVRRRMANSRSSVRLNAMAGLVAMVVFIISLIGTILLSELDANVFLIVGYFVLTEVLGLYMLFAIKIADQWEKAVVLRLGKFQGLQGPGLFWIIPIVDRVSEWIDHRVMVSPFSAEKTLTKDTVPVDVDAVLFWVVWDAEKAALEVEDYRIAITWAAQTALREVIGVLDLADILVGRAKMDKDLQKIIDERTTPWGVSVQSVEIQILHQQNALS